MKNRTLISIIIFVTLLINSVVAQPIENKAYLNKVEIDLLPSHSFYAKSSYVQEDGMILIAGKSQNEGENSIFLTRIYPDGTPDLSFGHLGLYLRDFDQKGEEVATSVSIIDSKIILTGNTSTRSFVLRLDSEGRTDQNFGQNGILLLNELNTLNDHSSYKTSGGYTIVLSGAVKSNEGSNTPALMCVNDRGEVCRQYGKNGIAMVCPKMEGQLKKMSVAKNGNLIAVGTIYKDGETEEDALVAKFKYNGKLDKKFGSGTGFVCIDGPESDSRNTAYDLHIDQKGHITVCGDYFVDRDADAYVFRLTRSGQLDHSFGNKRNGYYRSNYANESDEVNTLLVQENGRIIIGGRSNFNGNFDFNLTRLHSNGMPDLTFKRNSWDLVDFREGQDKIQAMQFDKGNNLIVIGNSSKGNDHQIVLARYPIGKPIHVPMKELVKF